MQDHKMCDHFNTYKLESDQDQIIENRNTHSLRSAT